MEMRDRRQETGDMRWETGDEIQDMGDRIWEIGRRWETGDKRQECLETGDRRQEARDARLKMDTGEGRKECKKIDRGQGFSHYFWQPLSLHVLNDTLRAPTYSYSKL